MKSVAAVIVCWAACAVQAQSTERRNWFEDPFFRVSAGIAECPVPLGPLITQEEQRREAHYRVERGTSCWLAGKCKDSNAYRYDKLLASPVEAALKSVPDVGGSSVWVAIQRRWVFLEGCVASREQAAQFEAAARRVPDVESVVPALGLRGESPRYPLLAPAR
ncbi:MAG: BON domain-containing protein [Ramlibacter sp.]